MAMRKTHPGWLSASLLVIAAGLVAREHGPAGREHAESRPPPVWTSGVETDAEGREIRWAAIESEPEADGTTSSPAPLLGVACGPDTGMIFIDAGPEPAGAAEPEPPPEPRTCTVTSRDMTLLTTRHMFGTGGGISVLVTGIDNAIRVSDPDCAAWNESVKARWAALPRVAIAASRGRRLIPLQIPGHFEELYAGELPAWRASVLGRRVLALMQVDSDRNRLIAALPEADSVTVSRDGKARGFSMEGAAEAIRTVASFCPDRPAYRVVEPPPGSGDGLFDALHRRNPL
ncbi:hypothetical protein [Propylenella binzhouense]|uniref:Uncharacterized protein n=1 Tax=Propylenella binzhouense TaxID=2555902 RepID=A0A964T667_9HYPH|nr:hypothetical protein [Propylenella binzhouense]MYZ48865.1 hypothetical protein [Propylenella binzhouense]